MKQLKKLESLNRFLQAVFMDQDIYKDESDCWRYCRDDELLEDQCDNCDILTLSNWLVNGEDK